LIDIVGIPPWLQWQSATKYLPAEAHNENGFKNAVKQIVKVSGSEVTGGPVLAFGLLLREIHRVHFIDLEEGYPPGTPAWVINSPFELNWVDIVFDAISTFQ
jgi:hypothetical protein